MKTTDMLWAYLDMEKEYNVYVIGQKSDIFIPFFIWTKPPTYVEISKDTLVADVKVTKNLLIKNRKNCNEYDDSSYSSE